MEDADNIVLPILRQVGCDLPEDVSSIAQFTGETFYAVCTQVCRLIAPNFRLNQKLPKSTAARYRLTTSLAEHIKSMGYINEVGYETFLYANPTQSRRLLVWLIERLPKTEDEHEEQPVFSEDVATRMRVRRALGAWKHRRWHSLHAFYQLRQRRSVKPFRSRPLDLPHSLAADPAPSTKHRRTYEAQSQLQLAAQTGPQTAASVINHCALETARARQMELRLASSESASDRTERLRAVRASMHTSLASARDLALRVKRAGRVASLRSFQGAGGAAALSGAFARRAAFGEHDTSAVAPSDATEESKQSAEENLAKQQAERDAAISALESTLRQLQAREGEARGGLQASRSAVSEADRRLAALLEAIAEAERGYQTKKKTLGLLPEADAHLKRMRAAVSQARSHLMQLAAEWEPIRVALVEKYRRKKQQLLDRKHSVAEKVEQIKRMRAELVAAAAEVRAKEALLKGLRAEHKQLPANRPNRQFYVQRIMDIMKNVDKQKEGIQDILKDIRTVQREINTVSAASGRSFDMADDIIFRNAQSSKDVTARTTYKHLGALRDRFASLMQLVEGTGTAKSDLRNTQLQIDSLQTRGADLNMERVTADLKAVIAENKALKKQAKKLMRAAE